MSYKNYHELVHAAEAQQASIGELVLQAEMERQELTRDVVYSNMQRAIRIMEEAADAGLKNDKASPSGLSGGDAKRLYNSRHRVIEPLMADAVAIGLAVNECSAALGRIVACPTAGSCGIVPGAVIAFKRHRNITDDAVCMAMFTAGGIGQIVAHSACISGAEGGCQAECGTAAAMAAGAIAELAGGSPTIVVQAATLAMKNLLGLACDPVAGLVEVPCIKRNGILAGFSLIAAEMALCGITSAIPPDEVVSAMYEIGKLLPSSLRETAEAGLANTPTGLEWKQKIQA